MALSKYSPKQSSEKFGKFFSGGSQNFYISHDQGTDVDPDFYICEGSRIMKLQKRFSVEKSLGHYTTEKPSHQSQDNNGLNGEQSEQNNGVHKKEDMQPAETKMPNKDENGTPFSLLATIKGIISRALDLEPLDRKSITKSGQRGSAVDEESTSMRKARQRYPEEECALNVVSHKQMLHIPKVQKVVAPQMKIFEKDKIPLLNNKNVYNADKLAPSAYIAFNRMQEHIINVNTSLGNLDNSDSLLFQPFAIRRKSLEETSAQLLEIANAIKEKKIQIIDQLELRRCLLKKELLQDFLELIDTAACKISEFRMDYIKNAGELIPHCCEIINKCDTSRLSLEFDHLKNEDMKALLDNLTEGKTLESLNISYNKGVNLDGYGHVGDIVQQRGVRILRAADCDISDKSLEVLLSSMREAKLEELDISWSKNLTEAGFAHLGKFVRNKGVRRLKMSGFQLTAEKLGAFYKTLGIKTALEHSKQEHKDNLEEHEGNLEEHEDNLLDELDVSYNSTMEPEAYTILGTMVKICGVKKLSLAGCGVNKEHLMKLRQETQEHAMKSMDVADNSSIGDGIVEIAKIVKESKLEELDISDCNLVAHELSAFRKELGKAKLICLSLGDRHNEPDSKYVSEVCELLGSVEELKLKLSILRESCRNEIVKRKQDQKIWYWEKGSKDYVRLKAN